MAIQISGLAGTYGRGSASSRIRSASGPPTRTEPAIPRCHLHCRDRRCCGRSLAPGRRRAGVRSLVGGCVELGVFPLLDLIGQPLETGSHQKQPRPHFRKSCLVRQRPQRCSSAQVFSPTLDCSSGIPTPTRVLVPPRRAGPRCGVTGCELTFLWVTLEVKRQFGNSDRIFGAVILAPLRHAASVCQSRSCRLSLRVRNSAMRTHGNAPILIHVKSAWPCGASPHRRPSRAGSSATGARPVPRDRTARP